MACSVLECAETGKTASATADSSVCNSVSDDTSVASSCGPRTLRIGSLACVPSTILGGKIR